MRTRISIPKPPPRSLRKLSGRVLKVWCPTCMWWQKTKSLRREATDHGVIYHRCPGCSARLVTESYWAPPGVRSKA